ncbi:G patch domain-containing protein 4-like [Styela clava]
MAETISHFAKSHMKQTGWVEGKGLGRNEDGMSEAIKVKIKADNAGIGHDPGEQFTFHWWEHAFQRSAQNIKVTEKEHGVEVEAKSETEKASTRKQNKKLMKKQLMYGSFVKSGTLENGKVQKCDNDASSDENSDSEKGDTKKSKILNDEELLAACGGRTAHKGARHGVNLGGKLARLKEQESETLDGLINKKNKKKRKYEGNGQKLLKDENETVNKKKDKAQKKRKLISENTEITNKKLKKQKNKTKLDEKTNKVKKNKSKKKKNKKSKIEPEC